MPLMPLYSIITIMPHQLYKVVDLRESKGDAHKSAFFKISRIEHCLLFTDCYLRIRHFLPKKCFHPSFANSVQQPWLQTTAVSRNSEPQCDWDTISLY